TPRTRPAVSSTPPCRNSKARVVPRRAPVLARRGPLVPVGALQDERLDREVRVAVHLRQEPDHFAARELFDRFREGLAHRVLERVARCLDGLEAPGIDQRPLDRGVDVLEEADHVVRAHHGARAARPSSEALPVNADDCVGDRGSQHPTLTRAIDSLVHGRLSLRSSRKTPGRQEKRNERPGERLYSSKVAAIAVLRLGKIGATLSREAGAPRGGTGVGAPPRGSRCGRVRLQRPLVSRTGASRRPPVGSLRQSSPPVSAELDLYTEPRLQGDVSGASRRHPSAGRPSPSPASSSSSRKPRDARAGSRGTSPRCCSGGATTTPSSCSTSTSTSTPSWPSASGSKRYRRSSWSRTSGSGSVSRARAAAATSSGCSRPGCASCP